VYCRGEIYVGDEVKRISHEVGVVHNGWTGTGTNCAAEYAMERVYDHEGVIDANGDVN
jgi:copper oxidase (laccase) domain-containing protein